MVFIKETGRKCILGDYFQWWIDPLTSPRAAVRLIDGFWTTMKPCGPEEEDISGCGTHTILVRGYIQCWSIFMGFNENNKKRYHLKIA